MTLEQRLQPVGTGDPEIRIFIEDGLIKAEFYQNYYTYEDGTVTMSDVTGSGNTVIEAINNLITNMVVA